MKGPVFLIFASLATLSCVKPTSGFGSLPTLEVQGKFYENDIPHASGLVELQAGPISVSAGRDTKGTLGAGIGLYEARTIPLGNFGKISVKATSSMDGMYRAVADTEVYTGSRSYNPLTVTLSRKENGVEYSGQSDLGYLGGTFIANTASNVVPKFEVHLNTDGWVTAVAQGRIKNGQVVMDSYNAGFNFGLVSGAMNMNGDRTLLDYTIEASMAFIRGAMKVDRANNNERTYRAGVTLGAISFDTERTGEQKSYSTVLDAGILRFAYNIDKNAKTFWKGTIEMANFGLDYEVNENGVTIAGGRIQLGSSIIDIHRDSTGQYVVKVNRGTTVE